MKKYLVILLVIMFASFLMSGLFFFSSGIFNFENGDINQEVAISVVSELEQFGVNSDVGEGIYYYDGKNEVPFDNSSSYS